MADPRLGRRLLVGETYQVQYASGPGVTTTAMTGIEKTRFTGAEAVVVPITESEWLAHTQSTEMLGLLRDRAGEKD